MANIKTRASARIVKIKEIVNAIYSKSENEPGYLLINNQRVFRVNITGIIINKNESESAQTITIDDGTGNIDIRTFEMMPIFDELDIGDIVTIIGKPREYGRKYILLEIIRKLDNPKWPEFVDLFETVQQGILNKKANAQTTTQTPQASQNSSQSNSTQNPQEAIQSNSPAQNSPTNNQLSSTQNSSQNINPETQNMQKPNLNSNSENSGEYTEIDVSELIKPTEETTINNENTNENSQQQNENITKTIDQKDMDQNNLNQNNLNQNSGQDSDLENINNKQEQLEKETKKYEDMLSKVNQVLDIIKKLDNDEGADYDDIEKEYQGNDLDELILRLLESGDIYEARPRKYKVL